MNIYDEETKTGFHQKNELQFNNIDLISSDETTTTNKKKRKNDEITDKQAKKRKNSKEEIRENATDDDDNDEMIIERNEQSIKYLICGNDCYSITSPLLRFKIQIFRYIKNNGSSTPSIYWQLDEIIDCLSLPDKKYMKIKHIKMTLRNTMYFGDYTNDNQKTMINKNINLLLKGTIDNLDRLHLKNNSVNSYNLLKYKSDDEFYKIFLYIFKYVFEPNEFFKYINIFGLEIIEKIGDNFEKINELCFKEATIENYQKLFFQYDLSNDHDEYLENMDSKNIDKKLRFFMDLIPNEEERIQIHPFIGVYEILELSWIAAQKYHNFIKNMMNYGITGLIEESNWDHNLIEIFKKFEGKYFIIKYYPDGIKLVSGNFIDGFVPNYCIEYPQIEKLHQGITKLLFENDLEDIIRLIRFEFFSDTDSPIGYIEYIKKLIITNQNFNAKILILALTNSRINYINTNIGGKTTKVLFKNFIDIKFDLSFDCIIIDCAHLLDLTEFYSFLKKVINYNHGKVRNNKSYIYLLGGILAPRFKNDSNQMKIGNPFLSLYYSNRFKTSEQNNDLDLLNVITCKNNYPGRIYESFDTLYDFFSSYQTSFKVGEEITILLPIKDIKLLNYMKTIFWGSINNHNNSNIKFHENNTNFIFLIVDELYFNNRPNTQKTILFFCNKFKWTAFKLSRAFTFSRIEKNPIYSIGNLREGYNNNLLEKAIHWDKFTLTYSLRSIFDG